MQLWQAAQKLGLENLLNFFVSKSACSMHAKISKEFDMSWSRVLKCARNHPTLILKSIQSGICWSLSQMCKNSPHLETGKSDMSLCSCFCDMSMDQSKAVPTHLHFDRCVCRKIEWIKLNLIAFFPPHSCMQLSKWGLVTTAFDESGCVYQALDWCQTPSGYLFWLTLDYHPSLFAP